MKNSLVSEGSARRDVALYLSRTDLAEHDWASQTFIATSLAALHGVAYAGVCGRDTGETAPGRYFVPTGTIVGNDQAAALGIHDQSDLFGGVVPHGFVCTKAITHGLVAKNAEAPDGWSPAFGDRVASSTLAGFTAFTEADALIACRRLLALGKVRLKSVHGIAGRGQWVIEDERAFHAAMAEQDHSALSQCGIVLEQHLYDVVTYSVGHICVGDLTASYVGTQSLTQDNEGNEVYGGSQLHIARGGFDALSKRNLSAVQRRAVEQAEVYDAAALSCFPGLIASRRNYDTVGGKDARGNPLSGVLEQSWRSGGATPAELLALDAFAADDALDFVTASTVECYGEPHPIPKNANVYFTGVDSKVGAMTKYAFLELP